MSETQIELLRPNEQDVCNSCYDITDKNSIAIDFGAGLVDVILCGSCAEVAAQKLAEAAGRLREATR